MSYLPTFNNAQVASKAVGPLVAAPNNVAPTANDWERYRPLIKRLYLDESRKLKEVIAIMASQHGHHATPKMYKDRISKWKFEKKNKELDMLAILHKKTQRESAGKKTSFRVRGQAVTMNQVLHYFKRKKMQVREASAASTPSDVSYRTPSPVPVEPSLENDNRIVLPDYDAWLIQPTQTQTLLSTVSTNHVGYTETIDMEQTFPAPFIEDEHILQLTVNGMYNFLSHNPNIPRSPLPPQTLLISERLLFTIKTYVDGSFERGTWITDEDGWCISGTSMRKELSDWPSNFYTFCNAAVNLAGQGCFVEFRRTLSKALSLVQVLIQSDHPRTLDSFFDAFLLFRDVGRPEIVELLLKYIYGMATEVCTKEYPRAQIYQLLATLEEESFEQVVLQSWKCTLDGFDKALGPFHKSSLNARINFYRRLYRSDSPVEEENHIRSLLTQCEEISSTFTGQICGIKTVLGWNLIDQERYVEAEELGLDTLSQAQEQDWYNQQVEALQLIAWSQYRQNKISLAERNMRAVIERDVDNWGMTGAFAIDNIVELERWLREWGREGEADKLKAEIDKAMKDEIDKQFDV